MAKNVHPVQGGLLGRPEEAPEHGRVPLLVRGDGGRE